MRKCSSHVHYCICTHSIFLWLLEEILVPYLGAALTFGLCVHGKEFFNHLNLKIFIHRTVIISWAAWLHRNKNLL